MAYGATLEQPGMTSSTGSVGDAFDNALAENVNGTYKNELIHNRPHRPGGSNATEVELATLDWMYWWNTARLHEGLIYMTPAEVGAITVEMIHTNLELENSVFV